MKKASVKHKKHKKNSLKISSRMKGWFLKSGCDFRVMAEFLLASVLMIATFVFGFYYQQNYLLVVPQGVTFQGQDVSGLHRPELEKIVRGVVYQWEQERVGVWVGADGNKGINGIKEDGGTEAVMTLPAKDWGVEVDVDQTVSEFFQMADRFGRADVLAASRANQKTVVVPTFVVKDLSHVLSWIQRHERPARDADLILTNGQWILAPEQEGLTFSEQQQGALEDQLKALLLQTGTRKTLPIVLDRLPAKINRADLQPLVDQIAALTAPKMSWIIDGQTTNFSLADHQEMIAVDVEKRSVQPDEKKLRQFVADLAAAVDRTPGDVNAPEPVLQDKGYLKADYEGTFDKGRELDQDALVDGILAALSTASLEAGTHASAAAASVDAKFIELNPRITLAGTGELSLLSQGKSSFKLGNIPDRIYNVKKGLGKFDGVVIAPGEEFSFDQKLGVVSYGAGWKPALAIFGGGGLKMVPGGGLCQVSTTMYRAAVWAGLPVTKRKPHSLDVSYYHEYGYGIDATVYPPQGLDLKFVNDTGGPILIHTYTIDAQTDAIVEFYGLSDGRSVELTPKSNFRPASGGRYISWNWNITREDGSVDERTIETFYKGVH